MQRVRAPNAGAVVGNKSGYASSQEQHDKGSRLTSDSSSTDCGTSSQEQPGKNTKVPGAKKGIKKRKHTKQGKAPVVNPVKRDVPDDTSHVTALPQQMMQTASGAVIVSGGGEPLTPYLLDCSGNVQVSNTSAGAAKNEEEQGGAELSEDEVAVKEDLSLDQSDQELGGDGQLRDAEPSEDEVAVKGDISLDQSDQELGGDGQLRDAESSEDEVAVKGDISLDQSDQELGGDGQLQDAEPSENEVAVKEDLSLDQSDQELGGDGQLQDAEPSENEVAVKEDLSLDQSDQELGGDGQLQDAEPSEDEVAVKGDISLDQSDQELGGDGQLWDAETSEDEVAVKGDTSFDQKLLSDASHCLDYVLHYVRGKVTGPLRISGENPEHMRVSIVPDEHTIYICFMANMSLTGDIPCTKGQGSDADDSSEEEVVIENMRELREQGQKIEGVLSTHHGIQNYSRYLLRDTLYFAYEISYSFLLELLFYHVFFEGGIGNVARGRYFVVKSGRVGVCSQEKINGAG